MLDLGGVRDPAELTRRLAVTAALLVVYRLGKQIPLPGINSEALPHVSGIAMERISILALGITPLVTVLILAELLKVIAPSVRRWEHADACNRDKLSRIVVGLSLLAAAAQASGLALALEDVRGLIEEPGTAFRLICIATLVGGAAIVIWLANQITRHGLGSGVWLLLVTIWLAELPHQTFRLVAQGTGSAVAVELILGWGLTAVVLAAIVALIRAGGDTLATAATCLWSKLLAGAVWSPLILAIGLVVGGGSLRSVGLWISPGNPILLLVLAGLVALFVHLYMRSQRIAGSAVSPLPPAVLAGGLAAITVVEMARPAMHLVFVVALIGHLVLVAVVALSILARWWQPPFEAAAPRDARGSEEV